MLTKGTVAVDGVWIRVLYGAYRPTSTVVPVQYSKYSGGWNKGVEE